MGLPSALTKNCFHFWGNLEVVMPKDTEWPEGCQNCFHDSSPKPHGFKQVSDVASFPMTVNFSMEGSLSGLEFKSSRIAFLSLWVVTSTGVHIRYLHYDS